MWLGRGAMVITDLFFLCVCNVFRKLSPALDDII